MDAGSSIQVRNREVTIARINELELFMLASFIRKLAEAVVTPDMWYAIAHLIALISPETLTGDDPLVEVNTLEKTGRVNLTGEEFNELFAAIHAVWSDTNGDVSADAELATNGELIQIDPAVVEEMRQRIAMLESEQDPKA